MASIVKYLKVRKVYVLSIIKNRLSLSIIIQRIARAQHHAVSTDLFCGWMLCWLNSTFDHTLVIYLTDWSIFVANTQANMGWVRSLPSNLHQSHAWKFLGGVTSITNGNDSDLTIWNKLHKWLLLLQLLIFYLHQLFPYWPLVVSYGGYPLGSFHNPVLFQSYIFHNLYISSRNLLIKIQERKPGFGLRRQLSWIHNTGKKM